MKMIKVKDKINEFKNIFKVIGGLCSEVDINCLKDQMYIRAVHASNHCLLTFDIKKNLFDEYDIKEDMIFKVDTELFNKVINIVGKKELELDVVENKVVIKNNKSKFNLSYFVGKKDDRKRPEIQTTSKWLVNTNEFFSKVSDVITFSTIGKLHGHDKLNVGTKSHMIDGLTEIKSKKIESDDCCSYYDLTYFDVIKDIKGIFKEIRLGFSKGEPCVIRGTNDYIDFEWILAPRMEEDNE